MVEEKIVLHQHKLTLLYEGATHKEEIFFYSWKDPNKEPNLETILFVLEMVKKKINEGTL